MSIDTERSLTQEESDHQAMLAHAFKRQPIDPEIVQRVRERADSIRKQFRASGMKLDAVELIKEARNDL